MTSNTEKVALITGGGKSRPQAPNSLPTRTKNSHTDYTAGGIGQAVAQALASQGTWHVHIVDIKTPQDTQQAASASASALPPNTTTFHHADILNYDDLAAAFRAAFRQAGRNRLDFVFANAGTIELPAPRAWPATADFAEAPPPPDFGPLDVNLRGGINTVHLARHYLNLSPGGGGSIVITASSAGIWPAYFAPMYTASKCESEAQIFSPFTTTTIPTTTTVN